MAESFTVFVDPNFNPGERQAIGRAVVDYILQRTRSGLGIGNIPFHSGDGTSQYSKAYQDHKDFGRAGKSSSPINMTFTGNMLASIRILDFSLAGQIVIGISDQQNAEKVVWMREKGYLFLGLSNEEKNVIVSRFAKLTPTQITAALAASIFAAQLEEEEAEEVRNG